MTDLSYNLSPILSKKLSICDDFRKEILLTPLSPKLELEFRWKALINRVFHSMHISGSQLTKVEITKLITFDYGKDFTVSKKNDAENSVLKYKKAMDYISQNWLVNKDTVLLKDVLMLYDILIKGRLVGSSEPLYDLLSYIQAREEHPVIQAGLVSIGVSKIQPFTEGNGRFSRLLSYLFLYKLGYDVRGLIGFETVWSEDNEVYFVAIRTWVEASSVTIWLEYFAGSVAKYLEEVCERIKDLSPDGLGISSSFWDLNERQKVILGILDQPGVSITNKTVQKRFKISQITASRDLSKLAILGLLFSHGKGRSVYYTKV